MSRGGKRPGSGRPKGRVNNDKLEAKLLLEENKDLIIQRAVALAIAKEPNIIILSKLLDKILPSLSKSQVETRIPGNVISTFSEDQLKSMIATLASSNISAESLEAEFRVQEARVKIV